MRESSGSQPDVHAVRTGREETRMRTSTPLEVLSRPKGRPGPKPRGRTVVPLTITVTHAQRTELEARADMEKSSISTIVRRFVAAGLAAGGLVILAALIDIIVARRTGAGPLEATKES